MAEEREKQSSDVIIDRLPPQNIEAEEALLGSLMLDKDAIIRVADFLRPQDFYKGIHKEIYKAMLDLYERRDPIDLLSMVGRLKERKELENIGGRSYLAQLINSVPTASHVHHYAQIVHRKKVLRDLISTSHDITLLGYQEHDDVDLILDEAEKKIFSISQRFLRQDFLPVKAALEEAFERIDKLHKHEDLLRGVATGFADLDNYLSGLQKADFVILAARPSIGKTAFVMDIARNVAVNEKVPVGIFSLEMSKEQVVDRLIASQAKVELWKLRTGRLSSQGEINDFTKLQQAIGVLSEAPIFIDDTASANVLQMRTMARRLQSEHGLGLIIVDYLQLMEPRRPFDSMVQQITEVSRSLKALARELNVPVLAVSQLSRAVEQRSPQIPRLSDLRESGCLAGDTLITRADTGERIPIKELARRKKQTPIPVYVLDNELEVRPQFMTKVFSSGHKKLYEIKTRSGRKIKASANHPFFKLNGWVRVDQLKINDAIALPRVLKSRKRSNPLSKNELMLLAHLIGDGCILPNRPFHYTSADLKNIKIVRRAASRLFNIKGRIVKQKNWYHIYLPSPYHLTHNKRHPITNWYNNLGLERHRSWNKYIPQAVFQCDNKKIELFLKHLWTTDGNIGNKLLPGRKPAASIYYSTSSEKLASSVQHLLLRLGIWSSLRTIPSNKGYRDMYHVYIEGRENQLKFLKNVGCVGDRAKIIPSLIKNLEKIKPNPNTDAIPREAWQLVVQPAKEKVGMSWRTFSRGLSMAYCGSTLFKHGISRSRMMRVYNVVRDENINKLANSDIFWDKIVSIKPLGVEEVFDATVDGEHNFIANDFIVHNSLEQDSDVVMFIYREDREKRETEKKNIAEIHIAKHRNGPIGKIELFFDEKTVSFKSLEKRHSE